MSQSTAVSAANSAGKGLNSGKVGLLSAVIIGISCIAPTYTLTSGLGPTISAAGTHVPAILLLGFLPMLLVAFAYRELNYRIPDSGTSFTWASVAFGPWVGWMGGWGLFIATVLVLSNLAAVAADFFFLLVSQIAGNPGIVGLTSNLWINIPTTLLFLALACWISYRGMQSTRWLQTVLVAIQMVALLVFSIAALVQAYHGHGFSFAPISLEWFNPFGIGDFSVVAAGISLSIFMYWGWDVTLTMNEETKDPEKTPGRAAMLTVISIILTYGLTALAIVTWAGTGETGLGAGNPDNQESILAALSEPVLGKWSILMSIAVLSSSFASLQSTMVSPARTLLSMSYYKALPQSLKKISPRFQTPSTATILSAVVSGVFYAVMRVISETALWDTIATLGLMVCFYYGITALACVWYFRRELFTSTRNVIFRFLFPLIGGLFLVGMAVVTLIDSLNPDYGSGSSIGGVGTVFIMSLVLLLGGVVVMIINYFRNPAFFRGETLPKACSTDGPSLAEEPSTTTDTPKAALI